MTGNTSGIMQAVDLFCGMGGATEGMQRAGLTVEAAYDYDAQAVAAHRQWHPDVPCDRRDVGTVEPHELAGRFVWASPSCKPWSVANRTKLRGQAHPEYYSLSKLARQAEAAAILVIENVVGLLISKEGRLELEELEQTCAELHKPMSVHVLASNEFGVSQHRKRAFIVIGDAPFIIARGDPIPAQYSVLATENAGIQTKNLRFARTSRLGRPVAECAALQGIPVPEGFSNRACYRLIGNAVPPVLGEAVCRAVLAGMALEEAA